ncbi:cytochrome p450-like protein [Dermatophagoides farinae]|nr:cytochrome p450-like protein [Dermatophagoides farinae]
MIIPTINISTLILLQWILLSMIIYSLISLLKWLHFKWNRFDCFHKQSIPYPQSSFWFGNLQEYQQNPYETLNKWCQQYGQCFGFFHCDCPILVINDRDAVQELLVKQGSKFPNRQKNKSWRHSRRVLTPPFTAHKIAMDSTRQAINLSVKRLLHSMEKKLSKINNNDNDNDNQLNITQHMNSITLDVICRLAFNMNDTDVHDDYSEFRQMVVDFMQKTENPNLRIIEYFPIFSRLFKILYYMFGNGKLLRTITDNLHEEIAKYYQEKIRNHFDEQNRNNHNDDDDERKKRKVNMLDFMIEQQELGNIDEQQLIGNAVVILLAGYETTATGLSFTLYLLAKYPEWQEKLREQIMTNFDNDKNDDYCQFDQNRQELLDRIWYESLRLYPPVISFITRRLETGVDECFIESLNLTITKEMTIMVPTWSLHHNEKYWPRPNHFDPYRQDLPIPGVVTSVKNTAFQAFGSGPRNCIGGNLAISESRAVITALLRHYRFDLIDENNPETDSNTGLLKLCCPTVIIHPLKNIRLRVTKI